MQAREIGDEGFNFWAGCGEISCTVVFHWTGVDPDEKWTILRVPVGQCRQQWGGFITDAASAYLADRSPEMYEKFLKHCLREFERYKNPPTTTENATTKEKH